MLGSPFLYGNQDCISFGEGGGGGGGVTPEEFRALKLHVGEIDNTCELLEMSIDEVATTLLGRVNNHEDRIVALENSPIGGGIETKYLWEGRVQCAELKHHVHFSFFDYYESEDMCIRRSNSSDPEEVIYRFPIEANATYDLYFAVNGSRRACVILKNGSYYDRITDIPNVDTLYVGYSRDKTCIYYTE